MLRRHIVTSVVLLSSALAGCVSTKTVGVAPSALAQYHGATVTVAHREKGSFIAQTAGKAMFGAIGAVAAVHAGNDIIRDDQVPDPAVSIGQALESDLAGQDGLRAIDTTVSTDTLDVSKLASQYRDADLLVDVVTTYWGLIYFPTNWSHYKLLYSVKLRLIDTKQAKLVAEGFCTRKQETSPDAAPTKAQLLDNQAAGLKKELADAAAYCTAEFREKALLESTVASR